MKKELGYSLYIILFLSLLAVPALTINTRKNVVSDTDNRELNEFPTIDINFSSNLENYLQDRIGFRDQMLTAYQVINDRFAHELVHPGYTYGKEGYVFFKMHENVVFDEYHKTFAEAVLKMQQYCELRRKKFYFLFEPEKTSVYRRYLPDGVNYNDEWVDELFHYMEELGINCVNNRDLLIDFSYSEQVFNQKFDAGHWNDLGCFYGTNNLWRRVHEDDPLVEEYSKEEFDLTTKNEMFLPHSKFVVNEEIPVFSLKNDYEDITGQYTGLKQDKRYPFFQCFVNRSKGAEKYPKILAFHGSYYNRNPLFFLGRASEYIGVHDYQNVLNLDYYYNVFQPDIVVFEVAEYTFDDMYFDMNVMSGLDFNPGLNKDYDTVKKAISKAKEEANLIGNEDDLYLKVLEGDGYDTVILDSDIEKAKYVYIFSESNIFDLQKNSESGYCACIPHNSLNKKATLYYVDCNGQKNYCVISTKIMHQLVSEPLLTEGVKNDEGAYYFRTNIEDNQFNMVALQIVDSVTGEYTDNIATAYGGYKCHDTYYQSKPSGWYKIVLKANSNLWDEAIEFTTYLENNESYIYSFDVNMLNEKEVTIDNYEFYGVSP